MIELGPIGGLEMSAALCIRVSSIIRERILPCNLHNVQLFKCRSEREVVADSHLLYYFGLRERNSFFECRTWLIYTFSSPYKN